MIQVCLWGIIFREELTKIDDEAINHKRIHSKVEFDNETVQSGKSWDKERLAWDRWQVIVLILLSKCILLVRDLAFSK